MTPAEWLEQVKKIDQLIDGKISEREKLWDMVTRTTGNMDGMPHGTGISDPVGNITPKLLEIAKEIDELIDYYVDYKQKVVSTLEQLPEKEYAVLHRYYIRYMTLEEIAEEMSYSLMSIWRFKAKGLKMLKDVIECYDKIVI